jgi:hypothetical protein
MAGPNSRSRSDSIHELSWETFLRGGLPPVLAVVSGGSYFWLQDLSLKQWGLWGLVVGTLCLCLLLSLDFEVIAPSGDLPTRARDQGDKDFVHTLRPFIERICDGRYIPSNKWAWRIAATLLALGIVSFVFVLIDTPSLPRRLGALCILTLALGFWQLLATVAFVWLPRRGGVPSLPWLPFMLAALFSSHNDNHLVRARHRASEDEIRSFINWDFKSRSFLDSHSLPFDVYLQQWVLDRVKSTGRSRIPLIVVTAEGGGLRAAYWTAAVLSKLEAESDGAFSRHVFAISSVSGGSLGAAAFVAGVAQAATAGSVTERRKIVSEVMTFLAQDYLSPILGYLVFPDLLQRFLPKPVPSFDRALALETSWEYSWRKLFGTDSLSSEFAPMTKGDQNLSLPLLFLNATEIESGRRFIISNVALKGADFSDSYFAFDIALAGHDTIGMPLSTAVHLSARFPFLSPAATFEFSSAGKGNLFGIRGPSAEHASVVWGRVADGGFFDNSGTVTGLEIVKAILKYFDESKRSGELAAALKEVELDVRVLMLPNDPRDISRSGIDPVRIAPSWPAGPWSELSLFSVITDAVNVGKIVEDSMTKQHDHPSGKERLSELVAPARAVLSTMEAHANFARTVLVGFLNRDARSQGCGDGTKQCVCASRAWELGLGLHLRDTWLLREMKKLDSWQRMAKERKLEPALGWYLSPASVQVMKEALAEPSGAAKRISECVLEFVGPKHESPPKH